MFATPAKHSEQLHCHPLQAAASTEGVRCSDQQCNSQHQGPLVPMTGTSVIEGGFATLQNAPAVGLFHAPPARRDRSGVRRCGCTALQTRLSGLGPL